MADSNAPEHKDRGLFGLFGKKDEKPDQHIEQQSHNVDTHATHAPAYTGQGEGGNAYGGEVHHAQPHQYGQGAGGNAYGGEVHHVPPSAMSRHEQYREEEGENKQYERKLHRSNSSSSSSSDEDEDGGKKERKDKRKKKGMKEKPHGYEEGETETQEKKGLMDKIKEKLPGSHEGENQY